MTLMLIGLVVFIGAHSLRILAPDWRDARVASLGANPWKAIIGALSIIGFVLMIWGYGQARQQAVMLWNPPVGLRHAVALFTLPAFILLVAAYLPGNHFKSRLGHPMVIGVLLWAVAHLLVKGQLHAVILFGSLLLWSMLSLRAALRREPPSRANASLARTLLVVVIGAFAWAVFAFYLHARWIGVAPFG
ncbi:MAG: NnrU family protein [Gammaproteobacteria bacterium]|nr:NnrU family protein [Gammaproteobacteria bacterium]